jgi:hypothetical protein
VLDQQQFLAYLASKGYISCIEYCKTALNFFLPSSLCVTAADNNQLETLQYLVANDCFCFGQVAVVAVGDIDVLKYAFEILKLEIGTSTDLCRGAASKGNVETLKYLLAKGFRWNKLTAMEAAEKNHVEVLRFARENNFPIALRMNQDLNTLAEFIDYCEDADEIMYNAATSGDLTKLKWLFEEFSGEWDMRLAALTARSGSLECLKYVIEERGAETGFRFFEIGSVECLKYLVETADAKFDSDIYSHAVKKGQRDFVEYAIKVGIEMPQNLGITAAEAGNFGFFKWAVEEMKFDCSVGIPDEDQNDGDEDLEDVFMAAVHGESIEILKYAFEKKLPKHFSTPQLLQSVLKKQYFKDQKKFVDYLMSVEPIEITPYMLNDAIQNCSPELMESIPWEHEVKVHPYCELANFAYLLKQIGPQHIGESLTYQLLKVKYAFEHQWTFDTTILKGVLPGDNVDLLRYLVQVKVLEMNEELLAKAKLAKAGFCLKFITKKLQAK